MVSEKIRVASGVSHLDRLLGGLYIGDNVVWQDDAGSLASVFCLNFIQASQAQNKSIIYFSFDRSPKNLLEKLGRLADYKRLTIVDCFTHGKGGGSDVFLNFYEKYSVKYSCQIISLNDPRKVDSMLDAFFEIHKTMTDDVRLVFESLTGMQELWGGEEYIINFYSHSCPLLYELNTIAYWVMEKKAHTPRLRAKINQIAQVAIELSARKGKTSLTILKAEKRDLDALNKPVNYRSKDLRITFDSEKPSTGWFDLGLRLREFRIKRGLSQTELAKLTGVTPSSISQIESNLIYPSLPGLLKIAEVLGVEVGSFFQKSADMTNRVIFPYAEAVDVNFPDMPDGSIYASLLTPVDFMPKAIPYMIKIPPQKTLPSHFFIHKGEEIGYLLSGKLQLKLDKAVYTVRARDVIYLSSDIPTQWKNPGPALARLLWIKIK
ncbi:MAG: helix-turn-helix domain-containing protein [Desulfobacterales bacterium]|uniref:Helix-turn-helix domain-containing protein n=1 Tax=Candidatus Desulfaltia bathyphila TaxID=2841697 RepID=A0A8J6N5U1_9BACT|nr:helix-turn-helix domain-containing protein [Candidatus Desulfaltia bathyphila]MBL7195062.1 helix-turn-helix domain-containing protein [Desulfobacterales bacterium]MBL7207123.1 helix-turn-helix domain-containing protein [Desulfobacterales bacterium]